VTGVNREPRVLLLSDFTVDNLRGYLENLDGAPTVSAVTGPFGQVIPALVDPGHEVWRQPYDAAVVWTRLQGVAQTFARAVGHDDPSPDAFLAEVDAFADLVIRATSRVGTILVPTWVLPPWQRGLGPIDLRAGGLARLVLEANLVLARRFDDHPGVLLLNASRWVELAGPDAQDPRSWYLGKIPFAPKVFEQAATDIRAALAGALGQARKLVVVDLDDTLWGGIIGDDGIEGIRLGGHDPIGEAFADLQEALLALRRRGVLLAIASKNDEQVALEAIRSHPEMRLGEHDFVAWRIDWNDKAANIASLTEELNLGLQSVVFLDDNPAERARVAEELPEVLVPELPRDKTRYAQIVRSLTCFDTTAVNTEDRARTELYAAERQRTAEQATAASLDDWLASLKLAVTVEPLDERNLARIVQLLNKTNQMNLTTRRLTGPELEAWVAGGDRALWGLRVEDRFGDSGLTGIVSVDCEGTVARIVDLVLSCRVFGRQIERLMLHLAVDHARGGSREALVATYVPTAKNRPTLEFLDSSGLDVTAAPTYRWDLSQPYPAPGFITVW
jgi:FkbH-like protein